MSKPPLLKSNSYTIYRYSRSQINLFKIIRVPQDRVQKNSSETDKECKYENTMNTIP